MPYSYGGERFSGRHRHPCEKVGREGVSQAEPFQRAGQSGHFARRSRFLTAFAERPRRTEKIAKSYRTLFNPGRNRCRTQSTPTEPSISASVLTESGTVEKET